MGKHIKTSMDEKVIDYLAIEVYKLDPENAVLKKFLGMDNFEGTELQKTIREYSKKYESKYFRFEAYLKLSCGLKIQTF